MTSSFQRHILSLLAAAMLPCCGAELPAESAPTEAGDSRPSFILISLDTMRADHVGAYGYERNTTPHFDALAAEGVLFDSAVTTASNTLLAHASLLTGLFPLAHGANHRDGGKALSDSCRTLAEDFAAGGYATGAFTAHDVWLSSDFGMDQGFAHFDSSWDNADTILPKAAAWIEAQAGRPFFLFVHLYDIHSEFDGRPYDSLPPYLGRWTDDYQGPFAVDWNTHKPAGSQVLRAIEEGAVESGPEDIAHFASQYDEGLASTDDRLGNFVGGLAEQIRDNAYLVITSDHGESFLDHGTMLHRFVFEETVRVPLLIVPPRSAVGQPLGTPRHVSEQVSLVDIRPTLLGLAGLPPGDWVQGADLSSWLAGDGTRNPSGPASLHIQALRFDDYKLILTNPTGAGPQLFNLRDDPTELHDLSAQPDQAERMRVMVTGLKSALREQREINNQLLALEGASADVEMSDEARQSLQALGYLGDDDG
jgi:arylsulfatase A-like enzyme